MKKRFDYWFKLNQRPWGNWIINKKNTKSHAFEIWKSGFLSDKRQSNKNR